jgi:hypothetical protein
VIQLLLQHILREVAFLSQITNFSIEIAFQQELSSVSFRAFPLADEGVDLLVVEILGLEFRRCGDTLGMAGEGSYCLTSRRLFLSRI